MRERKTGRGRLRKQGSEKKKGWKADVGDKKRKVRGEGSSTLRGKGGLKKEGGIG